MLFYHLIIYVAGSLPTYLLFYFLFVVCGMYVSSMLQCRLYLLQLLDALTSVQCFLLLYILRYNLVFDIRLHGVQYYFCGRVFGS